MFRGCVLALLLVGTVAAAGLGNETCRTVGESCPLLASVLFLPEASRKDAFPHR